MKITVAKNAGFCFGVKRAYNLACECAKKCRKPVHVLGKLVHNQDVVDELEKIGVKTIGSLDDISGGTVIFTAHGTQPALHNKAKFKGLAVLDTICPNVLKAQKLAQKYTKKNYQVIVFGDKNHKEVRSIYEWADRKPKIVEGLSDLKKLKLKDVKNYCLISQTTQNVAEFKKIKDYFASKLPNFVYFNTICDSTDNRQAEVRRLAKTHDCVIVIGGRDSANSRRLYEIAKSLNPKSYFIENASQLKKSWLRDAKKIAITAGASTPEWIIREVIGKVQN